MSSSSPEQIFIAMNHPMRRDILRRMHGKNAISPRELAAEMDEPLSNVSYHVGVLVDCDVISLVRTKPVRGSMQHFYRLRIRAKWALEALGLRAA
jgi:DNA-binding transcriptional ArsR family regulator